jgi:hypothetical protein
MDNVGYEHDVIDWKNQFLVGNGFVLIEGFWKILNFLGFRSLMF